MPYLESFSLVLTSFSRPHRSRLSTCRGFLALVLTGLLLTIASRSATAQRAVGIDVSDFQSANLSWSALKNTYGITFGWAKAMEGTCAGCGGNNWPTFAANAKAAGVIIGPYHYARYDETNGPVAEANAFWAVIKSNVKADGLSLMPMLDIEASEPGQPENLATNTPAVLSQWIDTWCTTLSNNAFAAGFKIKPCIYSSSSFTADWFTSVVTKWNNDIAAYNFIDKNCPTCPGLNFNNGQNNSPGHVPWATWNFWQYDDENQGEAITTGDGDVFDGTLAELTNTMVVVAAGPIITTSPLSRTVSPGTNVTFTVAATGNGTVHYQWAFDGTNIAGATTTAYSVPNVQLTNAGAYSVLVTDSTTVKVTNTGTLGVLGPLTNAPGAIFAPTSMVDWWPGEANARDIVGAGGGTGINVAFYSSPGEVGRAFAFDGGSGYVAFTNQASLAVPWTLCLWVNRQNTPQTSAAIVSDGTNSIKLEQYAGGGTFAAHEVGVTRLGISDNVFTSNYSLPVGIWTHLAFVGTSSGTQLYANGVSKGTVTNVFALPRLYLGATHILSPDGFVDFMQGSMDEVMVFNTALTGTQINTLVSAGTAGVIKGPVITSTSLNSSGQLVINFQGQAGKNFTIYSSINLKTWTTVGSLTNPNGTNSYTDVNTQRSTRRFYRISQAY